MKKQKKKKKQKKNAGRMPGIVLLLLAILLLGLGIRLLYIRLYVIPDTESKARGEYQGKIPRPVLDVELLTINEYSRPALALKKVNGVVVHYTANPMTSAIANRNYFEGLKDSHITKASSHFIVGLNGEIVQCIPCNEISYASNQRNSDTISIECCIEDDTGRFSQKTYNSLLHLTAWLVERYGLKASDVIRHYDVTGKNCPKYYVEHPAKWERFLTDVQAYLRRYGAIT